MKILGKLLINAIAFYIAAYILPGFTITGYEALFIVAIVWGVFSLIIRPALIFFTLPLNLVTLGLFTFVINAALLLLTAYFVPGFSIDRFTTALFAAVLLSFINIFLGRIVD